MRIKFGSKNEIRFSMWFSRYHIQQVRAAFYAFEIHLYSEIE